MGVCIQEMIDSESAGVMFTRHALTGSPKEMIITSNYGLGEVSLDLSQIVQQKLNIFFLIDRSFGISGT